MTDDLNRAEAWTQRLHDLDADNHDLRRRLRTLTDAGLKVLTFAGKPGIWTMLRPDERDAVHALAAALAYEDPKKEHDFWKDHYDQALDDAERAAGAW